MHDVAAVEPHARLLANGCAVANGTVVVLVAVEATVLGHLGNALGLETGQALLLASVAVAMVPTRQYLITARLHCVEALFLSAHVLERRLHGGRRLSHLLATEAALCCLLLIASLADVVGLCVALGAEVFVAGVASNAVLSHMLSGLSSQ